MHDISMRYLFKNEIGATRLWDGLPDPEQRPDLYRETEACDRRCIRVRVVPVSNRWATAAALVLHSLDAHVEAERDGRNGASVTLGSICVGPLRIDPENGDTWIDGRPILLTPTQQQLLKILARRPNRTVPYQTIAALLWGFDDLSGRHTLRVHLNRLRGKLGPAADQLTTVLGIGVRLGPALA